VLRGPPLKDPPGDHGDNDLARSLAPTGRLPRQAIPPRTIAGGTRRGGLRLPSPFTVKGEGQPQSLPGSSRKRQRKRQTERGSGKSRAVISGSAKGRVGPDFRSEFPDTEPTSRPRPRARDRKARAKLEPTLPAHPPWYFIVLDPVQRWPPKTAAIPAKAGQTFDRAGPMKGVR
jgi:hypothetical protein